MATPVNNGSAATPDYAAWVGQKNNFGAGGLSADQLGYDKYLQETNPDDWTQRVAQQQTAYTQMGGAPQTGYGSNPPSLAGLQASAGANSATALSAAAAAPRPPTSDPSGGTGFVPPVAGATPDAKAPLAQTPITSATPVAPPPHPKRRMITQSSHSLQGLRSANGAGY